MNDAWGKIKDIILENGEMLKCGVLRAVLIQLNFDSHVSLAVEVDGKMRYCKITKLQRVGSHGNEEDDFLLIMAEAKDEI